MDEINKTRRINITCDFKAVAINVKDFHYSANFLLLGNGKICNDDGSVDSDFLNRYISGHSKCRTIWISDNNFIDTYTFNSIEYNKKYYIPLTIGNLACVIDTGWKK